MKIGLEIHIQLNTKTKVFCGCPTSGNESPNTRTCEICTGQPGSKPCLNEEVLKKALKVALALQCKINATNIFSRKTYFYPDLSKNYQITQYELPLAINGKFQGVKIKRIHIEEDPGALIHKKDYCLVDYNRSGIPLIEVVTDPDLKSPQEARTFIRELITALEYLDVYDKKSDATLKADLNISTTGARIEIKNVNGLQDIERALSYEVERQKKETPKTQETRGWDAEQKRTFLQRTKETEADYGYITDPDLAIIAISKKEIESIRKTIPELAADKVSRFKEIYSLSEYDAKVLSQNKNLAHLYENVAKKVNPQIAASWITRDILKQARFTKKRIEELNIQPNHLIELLELYENKQITDNTAKQVLRELVEKKPFSPKEYVEKHKLSMKSDTKQLETWCQKAIKENPKAVEEYKNGNEKSLNFLMGSVMKLSNKTANPSEVIKLLKKLLN